LTHRRMECYTASMSENDVITIKEWAEKKNLPYSRVKSRVERNKLPSQGIKKAKGNPRLYKEEDLENMYADLTPPEGWVRLEDASDEYKRAAYQWFYKSDFRKRVFGAHTYYHPDDLADFDAQYKPNNPRSTEQWREAIYKHAPSRRAIMNELGYSVKGAGNIHHFFKRRPELKEMYDEASTINLQKKEEEHQAIIEAVKRSVDCSTLEEAIESVGVSRNNFLQLFLHNVGESAPAYFLMKERKAILRKHDVIKDAAKEAGVSPPVFSMFFKYQLGKTPKQLKREWAKEEV